MKILITLLFLLLVSRPTLFSQETDSSNRPPSRLFLAADPKLSMRSGTESILMLHHGWSALEDRTIGIRWWSEDNFLPKAGGIATRFAKLALLDLPFDYFMPVLGHEYYGHGSQYRDLNMGNIHYGFETPPPYGDGGGQASTNVAGGLLSDHQSLGIWEAGIEIHPQINKRLSQRWMERGKIGYREAMLYFWSWQIAYTYIQETNPDLTTGQNDNDPQAYVRILNRHEGFTDLNNLPFDVKDLQSANRINAANPFLLFALYAQLKTYLWDGDESMSLPVLRFWDMEYLPAFRMGLTPFGPGYHFENYLRRAEMFSIIDLHVGNQTFHKSWGGVGVLVENVLVRDMWSFSVNVNIWKQPSLEFGPAPFKSKGGGLGGACSLRGYFNFATDSRMVGFIEVGYKSVGFLEGYSFDSSPILMVGIGFHE